MYKRQTEDGTRSLNFQYKTLAVVTGCINRAEISAKKYYAGGIVGDVYKRQEKTKRRTAKCRGRSSYAIFLVGSCPPGPLFDSFNRPFL